MIAQQLDLFADTEQAERQRHLAEREIPGPCIYGSPARGIPARLAEFDAWRHQYGNFGSVMRSHAWRECITVPTGPTDRCQPSVFSADLRADRSAAGPPDCDCLERLGYLAFRGMCRGCDWEGPARERSENAAAEDALDHSWPGWRDLPTVPRRPDWSGGASQKERDAQTRWIAAVSAAYPPGWLEDGGPIRTERQRHAGRHVPAATPFGGYDMAVPAAAEAAA